MAEKARLIHLRIDSQQAKKPFHSGVECLSRLFSGVAVCFQQQCAQSTTAAGYRGGCSRRSAPDNYGVKHRVRKRLNFHLPGCFGSSWATALVLVRNTPTLFTLSTTVFSVGDGSLCPVNLKTSTR